MRNCQKRPFSTRASTSALSWWGAWNMKPIYGKLTVTWPDGTQSVEKCHRVSYMAAHKAVQEVAYIL